MMLFSLGVALTFGSPQGLQKNETLERLEESGVCGTEDTGIGYMEFSDWLAGTSDKELVDLELRCRTSRVNVVYLPAGSVLTIKVEANAGANFAFRVSRI